MSQMPYLHWELDNQRDRFATFIEKRSADHQDKIRIRKLDSYYQRRQDRKLLHSSLHMKGNGQNTPTCGVQTPHEITHDKSLPPDSQAAEAVMHRINRDHSDRYRNVTSQWPRRNRCGRIVTSNSLGQLLYDAFRLFETMSNYRDRKLIEKYLLVDPHMHPRRTLDQAYYWTLRNTKTRDRDQVVYRGTRARPEDLHHYDPGKETKDQWTCRREEERLWGLKNEMTPGEKQREALRKLGGRDAWDSLSKSATDAVRRVSKPPPGLPTFESSSDLRELDPHRDSSHHEECMGCRDAICKVPRLVMVDQLWMWILDSNTIITCFPKRYGTNRQDASGVHKAIRQRLKKLQDNQISSAYDIALIVVDECSNLFFDRMKRDSRQPPMVEMFSEAIANMVRSFTIFQQSFG